MSYSVLVVDDSRFFRKHLSAIIDSNAAFKVVGCAENGIEAIAMAEKLHPDIITMDYEMPCMDGVTAVRHIMRDNPTPILMLSSLTYEGARVTFDAFEAGALDFLPKKFDQIATHDNRISEEIHERLLGVLDKMVRKQGGGAKVAVAPSPVIEPVRSATHASTATHGSTVAPVATSAHRHAPAGVAQANVVPRAAVAAPCRLVVLAASTGGPMAIAEVLKGLPANFSFPIVVVQHMPALFTREFSERLDRVSALKIKEAEEGDKLQAGVVFVAPGGKQLLFADERSPCITLREEKDDRILYQPSVDITLASAATFFQGSVLAVVMTGMGEDGCRGARMLKDKGSRVWTQDEPSCVVYGMPGAVSQKGLSDRTVALQEIGRELSKLR